MRSSGSFHIPGLVFIVGTGRCGSSLIQELLARHPDVGFVSNLDDRLARLNLKGRWNNAVYRRVPDSLTRKGRLRFAPSEGYRVLARQVSPMLVEPNRDLTEQDASPWLADRLRRFFGERAHAQAKPAFFHKFTGWPRARFLHEVFPEARFIHVIRDGRAVANSLVQMDWWSGFSGPDGWRWGPIPDEMRAAWNRAGGSFVALAAIEWMLLMAAHEKARSHLPDECWMDVRYEDVVASPEEAFEQMLGFGGLTVPAGFSDVLRRKKISPKRVGAFRGDLTPLDLEIVEMLAGPTLERYGYA